MIIELTITTIFALTAKISPFRALHANRRVYRKSVCRMYQRRLIITLIDGCGPEPHESRIGRPAGNRRRRGAGALSRVSSMPRPETIARRMEEKGDRT